MKTAVLCVCAALGACSSDPGGVPLRPDGGPLDNGAVSTTYPAFPVDVGHVINNGGPVFSSMIIVTITWNTDPGQSTYDTFGDTIGGSNFWHSINSEYGIGPATSGAANHVHLDPAVNPPPSNDSDARNFVQSGISSQLLPAPTDQTVYAIYVPPDHMFTGGCTQFGGYHGEITAAGHHFAYSIIMNCAGPTDVGNATTFGSHELNETATDPYPNGNVAWAGFDDDHIAYELMLDEYDELGDVCWDSATGFYFFDDHEPGFLYHVQRQWSNASAMAGHAPCVPPLPTPYYGVTILPGQLETVGVNYRALGIATTHTKGLKAPLGTPRIVTVGFFSDRFTSNPWTLSANVPEKLPGSSILNGTAMVTVDKTSGKNGEKANITVTPMTFGATGAVYLELVSHLPGFETHTTPLVIAPQ